LKILPDIRQINVTSIQYFKNPAKSGKVFCRPEMYVQKPRMNELRPKMDKQKPRMEKQKQPMDVQIMEYLGVALLVIFRL